MDLGMALTEYSEDFVNKRLADLRNASEVKDDLGEFFIALLPFLELSYIQ